MASDLAVSFLVPIRHPDNIRDAGTFQTVLADTLRSFAAQTSPAWEALIIANPGTPLPDLPDRVRVIEVGFGPNLAHDDVAKDPLKARAVFRLDKGRRVAAGLRASTGAYYMAFDDDDFAHRDLVAFVDGHRGPPGWYVEDGFAVDYGGSHTIALDRFDTICGSTHVLRRDLLDWPAEDDPAHDEFAAKWLGGHGSKTADFKARGVTLAPVPFAAVAYLCRNPNSHSLTNTIWRNYILNRENLTRPGQMLRYLSRLKRIDAGFRRDFFGAAAHG